MKENRVRLCELKQKEVINCCDCKRLGFIMDVEIDVCTACVLTIIIPGPGKICGIFGREFEYIIPWKCIRQIGPDIILVEVKEEEVLVKC